MNEIIKIRGTIHVVWDCRTCGAISTCPESVWDQQRAEGGYHSCPSGHRWGWSKESCEREQLRRERDSLKQEAARLEDEKREAWTTANAQLERARKAESKVKTLTKRMAAGACPCCQRTFSNMSTHMKRQHPEYVKETGANVVPIKVGR